MPFEIAWYLQDRIILITVSGVLLDEESEMLDKEVAAYFEQSSAPLIHLVYDGTQQTKSPSMKAMLKSNATKHSKMGWAIIVGDANPIVKFASMVVGHASHAHYRFIPTLSEALEFLADVDSTLTLDQ